MAAPIIDWKDATVTFSVLVHQTTTSERQNFEFPLASLFERFERLEAALAGAVTAIEVVMDGGSTMSGEEIVERLLYPEGFGLAERMAGRKAWERIEIARTERDPA